MNSRSLALAILILLCSFSARPQAVSFKAGTDLVLVPVVVRDAQGNVVSNLAKEDFRLFDNGKAQTIASFEVEETLGPAITARSVPTGSDQPSGVMFAPQHFVAMLFDDEHFKIANPDPPPGYVGDVGDLWRVRDAAVKYLKGLKPSDRVAIFTTSGRVALDFTTDRDKLQEALAKLQPGKPVLPTVKGSNLANVEVEDQTLETING